IDILSKFGRRRSVIWAWAIMLDIFGRQWPDGVLYQRMRDHCIGVISSRVWTHNDGLRNICSSRQSRRKPVAVQGPLLTHSDIGELSGCALCVLKTLSALMMRSEEH